MKVFILEDDPDRIQWFHERFFKHDCAIIQTCAREYNFNPPYDLILLDHDLGGRQMDNKHEDSGFEFIKLIKDRIDPRKTVVIIHSYNNVGAKRMYDEVKELFRPYIAPFRGKDFNSFIDMVEERCLTSLST